MKNKVFTMNTTRVLVPIQLLEHAVAMPQYATYQSACFDLQAAIKEDIILSSGSIKLIPTGISLAIPYGFEAQIRPRSGLALKHGITVLNSPGTIDADYRGEIFVLLINHGNKEYVIERGHRIAQCCFMPIVKAYWDLTEDLGETERNTGGFGSTGI